jgi:hypothetical protein
LHIWQTNSKNSNIASLKLIYCITKTNALFDKYVIFKVAQASSPWADGFWCRQCEIKGDSIQYLRDYHGMSFQEASEQVGKNITIPRKRPIRTVKPQPEAWKKKARQTYLQIA